MQQNTNDMEGLRSTLEAERDAIERITGHDAFAMIIGPKAAARHTIPGAVAASACNELKRQIFAIRTAVSTSGREAKADHARGFLHAMQTLGIIPDDACVSLRITIEIAETTP